MNILEQKNNLYTLVAAITKFPKIPQKSNPKIYSKDSNNIQGHYPTENPTETFHNPKLEIFFQ
jgi:hypothetical protein